MEESIVFFTIIAAIVAIAQIGLFFKLWGMCNNIIKIRDEISPDKVNTYRICYMKGDMKECKNILDELLYADILKNYYSNYDSAYGTTPEYDLTFKRTVNDYKKKYEKIGLTMPDVDRYKDPTKFFTSNAQYMPKEDVSKPNTPKTEAVIPEPPASKQLKESSPDIFNSLLQEASLYHNDAKAAMDEVNKHCECLLKIPDAVNNEFVSLHTSTNGAISFHNLYFTHYSRNCSFDEFEFMNKGRCSVAKDGRIKVNNFLYRFDETLSLTGVYRVKGD
jgi:hypothetical protein